MSEHRHAGRLAPEGMVWRCRACGKRSRDLYGFHAIDRGYDASCMLDAELVEDTDTLVSRGEGESS